MLAFSIVLVVAGAGGFWLASIGLRPITRMADQASKIPLAGLQDLGESDRTDELGTLAPRVQSDCCHGCDRRSHGSAGSWRTPLTNCARRCR